MMTLSSFSHGFPHLVADWIYLAVHRVYLSATIPILRETLLTWELLELTGCTYSRHQKFGMEGSTRQPRAILEASGSRWNRWLAGSGHIELLHFHTYLLYSELKRCLCLYLG